MKKSFIITLLCLFIMNGCSLSFGTKDKGPKDQTIAYFTGVIQKIDGDCGISE